MTGSSIQSYSTTAKEAEEIKQVKRTFFNAGKIGIVSSIGTYAVGGLIHYFGGPEYASAANQIIQHGYLLTIGGAGSLFLSTMPPYKIL